MGHKVIKTQAWSLTPITCLSHLYSTQPLPKHPVMEGSSHLRRAMPPSRNSVPRPPPPGAPSTSSLLGSPVWPASFLQGILGSLASWPLPSQGTPAGLPLTVGPTHTEHLTLVCPAGLWTQLCTQTPGCTGVGVEGVYQPERWEGLQALAKSLTSPVSAPN